MNRKTIVKKRTNMEKVAEAVLKYSRRGRTPILYIRDWLDNGTLEGMSIGQLADEWDEGFDEGKLPHIRLWRRDDVQGA